MNAGDLRPYLPLAAVVAWLGWRYWRTRAVRAALPALLTSGAIVVDVRSPAEFAAASRPGSVNIPLGNLSVRCHELDPAKPVIVCCASGTRSALAKRLLSMRGFLRVVDAGPWTNTVTR